MTPTVFFWDAVTLTTLGQRLILADHWACAITEIRQPCRLMHQTAHHLSSLHSAGMHRSPSRATTGPQGGADLRFLRPRHAPAYTARPLAHRLFSYITQLSVFRLQSDRNRPITKWTKIQRPRSSSSHFIIFFVLFQFSSILSLYTLLCAIIMTRTHPNKTSTQRMWLTDQRSTPISGDYKHYYLTTDDDLPFTYWAGSQLSIGSLKWWTAAVMIRWARACAVSVLRDSRSNTLLHRSRPKAGIAARENRARRNVT